MTLEVVCHSPHPAHDGLVEHSARCPPEQMQTSQNSGSLPKTFLLPLSQLFEHFPHGLSFPCARHFPSFLHRSRLFLFDAFQFRSLTTRDFVGTRHLPGEHVLPFPEHMPTGLAVDQFRPLWDELLGELVDERRLPPDLFVAPAARTV